jgi:putative peptidoglycan lipid II flippase
MVANMLFNIIFAIPYGYVGLAMATALSASMNAGLLYYKLRQIGVYRGSKETLGLVIKVLISAAIMLAAVITLKPAIADWVAFELSAKIFELTKLIVIAGVIYGVSLIALGIRKSDFTGSLKSD